MLVEYCEPMSLSTHYSAFSVTTPEKPLRLEMENLDGCMYKSLLGNAIKLLLCQIVLMSHHVS